MKQFPGGKPVRFAPVTRNGVEGSNAGPPRRQRVGGDGLNLFGVPSLDYHFMPSPIKLPLCEYAGFPTLAQRRPIGLPPLV